MELFNFLILKENILVDIIVNVSILSFEYRKLLFDLYVFLFFNEIVFFFLYKLKEILKFFLYIKVMIECKIYIKEYIVIYLVIFENDKGEIIEMSGKWKGVFNKGFKVIYIFKDIK